ncbi:prophage CP4-57 integrase [Yersinia kristensenii]|nr:prophage CP4-57 integrase [Yersinia kristensenii]
MARTTRPLTHTEVQKAKTIDKDLTLYDDCIYATYQVMG